MEFFKKIALKIKVIFGVVIGLLGFIAFFFIRSKIRASDKMDYELARVKSELEIAHLEEDSVEKIAKVAELKEEETLIREKIKFLEEKEVSENRDVSLEELEEFFKNRDL